MTYPKWAGPRLQSWLEELRALPGRDLDANIPITGHEGSGKSTLAMHLGTLLDESFTHASMKFTGADFVSHSKDSQPGNVVVLDESIDGGFSREAMTEANRILTKHFVVSRTLRLLTFELFPNMRWLDSYISEHRARYWILVERRGVALVHRIRSADYRGAKPSWEKMFRFRYPAFEGPEWDAYLKAKANLVRGQKASKDEAYRPSESETKAAADLFGQLLHRMSAEA